MAKPIKVLHAQYKFNTNVSRGGNEQDYVVVYLENNSTDVMMQGYTQVPREHIHTQGEINDKDTAMDAFKKLDSAIRNRYFSHADGNSALKVDGSFTIDEQGVLGLNLVQLENRAAYNSLARKDDKAIYVWVDDGRSSGIDSGTITNPDTGTVPITPSSLSAHNTSATAHQDIRTSIESLNRMTESVNNRSNTNERELGKLQLLVNNITSQINTMNETGIQLAKLANRALTANRLTNPVTINGISFDGSSNITIRRVPEADVADVAKKLQQPVHINGVEFDGSSDITINSDTANTALRLANTVLINGIAFDGSQNLTIRRVEEAERADTATKLAKIVRINGVEFDGTSDINIPASAFSGLVVENSNKLGGKAADEYALKRDVYTKAEVYTKQEVYSKVEADTRLGLVPGGRIYISAS